MTDDGVPKKKILVTATMPARPPRAVPVPPEVLELCKQGSGLVQQRQPDKALRVLQLARDRLRVLTAGSDATGALASMLVPVPAGPSADLAKTVVFLYYAALTAWAQLDPPALAAV
jgi:hypothetical protein